MQVSQVSSLGKEGLPVAVLLWLGLGLAAATVVVIPVAAPGLSLALGVLTLFVAAVVATFSLRYMRADMRSRRYFLTLGALVAAVLAFVTTGNMLILAAAWCASGLLLAALIGHSPGWSDATAAARRARWAFLIGDAALLAALGILAGHAGTFNLDVALSSILTLPDLQAGMAALLLVVAASARCALPPFSGWLLCSMTAPTPVSALMHAGLVNAGGFLLIRFGAVLEAAPLARALAVILGLSGALYGIGIMMVRPDVKRSLAGSTVSQMGFMVMSCGLGAYAAALWHIIAHGLFKAWLFLGSGSAIGMKAGSPATPLSRRACLAIVAGTLGLAMSLLSSQAAGAEIVPLLLGIATAAATLVAAIGGTIPVRGKVLLLLSLAVLIAFHVLGQTLVQMAIGDKASPLVPDWVLLAILCVFLAAWIWQQRRLATGKGMPLRLYVHLINAGALPAADAGENR